MIFFYVVLWKNVKMYIYKTNVEKKYLQIEKRGKITKKNKAQFP